MNKVTYREGCKVITVKFDWCEYLHECAIWQFHTMVGYLVVREENIIAIKRYNK